MKHSLMKNVMKRSFNSAVLALAVVTALFSTACGNKNSGSSPAPVITTGIGAYGSCYGCSSGMGGYLDSALGYIQDGRVQAELGLQFYGSVNSGSMGGYFASSNFYTGSLMAQGRLYIMSGDSICPVPAGMYTLTPVSPGQLVYGRSFTGLVFQASGPTTMYVEVYGSVSADIGTPVVSRIDGSQFRFLITQGRVRLAGSDACNFPIN